METVLKSATPKLTQSGKVVLWVGTIKIYLIIYFWADDATGCFLLAFRNSLINSEWLDWLMPSFFLDKCIRNTCTEKLCGTCCSQTMVGEVPFNASITEHLFDHFLPNRVSQNQNQGLLPVGAKSNGCWRCWLYIWGNFRLAEIENSNVGYLGVRSVHNCDDLSTALVIDPTQMIFRAVLIIRVPICICSNLRPTLLLVPLRANDSPL